MDVATLLSADQVQNVKAMNVNSQYQHANTTKIASLNKSQCAAAHMPASATRISVAISVKLNVQKDTNLPSSHHMNVAQLPSVLNHQQPQQLQHQQPQHEQLIFQHTLQQLLQLLLHTFSQQLMSVSITKEHHETMVKPGKSMNVKHVAASPQALLNALSKHVTLLNVKKEPTKSELMILILAVLLHAAPHVHQVNATVNHFQLQHVNVTKISSVNQSMMTAVATSTTANATRTSASIFLKKLAQLATLELLSIPTLAAQLLNVVMSKPQQLLQFLQPQPLSQLLILQLHTSQHSLQSPSVLIWMVANDVMEKAGLLNQSHAQSTLATLSTTFVPPSVNVVTNELDARPMKLKSLTLLTNVALGTLVKNQDVKSSHAQNQFQNASTTKT
jgi:hypothetical protein